MIMAEIVYLLRLFSHALGCLLIGILIGCLGLHPVVRSFIGLPVDAVDQAFQAEVAFGRACPGQESAARHWGWVADPGPAPVTSPVKPGDIPGAINATVTQIGERLWRLIRPWLMLVGIRGTALTAMVVSALPLVLAVWLLGRRRSYLLFRRGLPATNAQRRAWVSLAGLVMLALGILISAPVAAPLTPWLLPTVVIGTALLYPIRAATAARI